MPRRGKLPRGQGLFGCLSRRRVLNFTPSSAEKKGTQSFVKSLGYSSLLRLGKNQDEDGLAAGREFAWTIVALKKAAKRNRSSKGEKKKARRRGGAIFNSSYSERR